MATTVACCRLAMRAASAISTSELMSVEKTTSTLPEISLACVDAVCAMSAERLSAGCNIQYSVELTAPTTTSAMTMPSGSGVITRASRARRSARCAQVDEPTPQRGRDKQGQDQIGEGGIARRRCDDGQAHQRDDAQRGDGERGEDLEAQAAGREHVSARALR